VNTVILILLIYASISGHEILGHAYELNKRGVKILEMGIGYPKGPKISYTLKKGKFAGTILSFYLLTFMVGAFVRENEFFKICSYKERAVVFCAGPFVNIHLGCLMFIAVFISSMFPLPAFVAGWGMEEWARYFEAIVISSPYLWGSLLFVPICWFGKKFISVYLSQIFGVVLFVWVCRTIGDIGVMNYFSELKGPIGIVAEMSGMMDNMTDAVLLAAQLSIGFGAINLLPIPPMDGGMLIMPAFEKLSPRLAHFYEKTGFIALASLMLFIFAQDIIAYIGYPGLVLVIAVVSLLFLAKKLK